MPTLLDLYASPRGARSRTLKLREAFLRGYQASHPGAQVMSQDLAHDYDQLPAFDEWDIEAKFEMAYGEGKLDAEAARRWNALTTLTDQLHASDLLVLSTPMWNFSIPWQLKRWIDSVVQARLTFEFRDGQFHGLLKGRPAVVLTTRDGAYGPESPFAAADYQIPYLRHILGFMGFDPVHVVVAEPLAMAGPEVAQAALARAIEQAEALGRRL